MCFGKLFHLILMLFISYIQCFEICFQKISFFFLKRCFFFFRFSIDLIWFSINRNPFEKFSKPLPGSIDRTSFSINRTLWIKIFFFKILKIVFDSFKTLFQTFLSLFDLARLHWGFFFIFQPNFCKVFLSQGR